MIINCPPMDYMCRLVRKFIHCFGAQRPRGKIGLGADAQKHPQLAVILRHISAMVPYPEVTVRKRFFKCTKQNFPMETRCQEQWSKTAVVCQQRPLLAARHGGTTPGETSQFYRRGAACSYSCSYLQKISFIFQIWRENKIQRLQSHCKKAAGEKKYDGGTGKYCNLKCFQFKLTSTEKYPLDD